MRINKRSQVEVSWKQEAGSPVEAWRGGEVVHGDGHAYMLRWNDCDDVSGRIPRESLRPQPPHAPVPRDLAAGELVEVFDDDDGLWKCAEVLGFAAAAADPRQFDVKIVGASKVLTVPPQRLRVRQMLRDDGVWVRLHKDNPVPVPSAMPRPYRASAGMGAGRGRGRGKGGKKPMAAPGSTPSFLKKRSFDMLGSSDTSSGGKRFEGDNNKRFKQQQPPLPNVCLSNKQDEMSGGDDRDNDDDVAIGINPDNDNDYQQQQPQHERKGDDEEEDDDDNEDDSSDSDSSSDDSSSSDSDRESDSRTRSIETGKDCPAAPTTKQTCNNDQKADQLQPIKKEQQHAGVKKEEHCDNDMAESREIRSEPQPLKDQMGAPAPATVREHIHRLELVAYSSTMKAFHACSDTLSWEKEALLSDMRVELHISNDEHLQMLNVILNRKGRTRGPH